MASAPLNSIFNYIEFSDRLSRKQKPFQFHLCLLHAFVHCDRTVSFSYRAAAAAAKFPHKKKLKFETGFVKRIIASDEILYIQLGL